MPMCSGSRAATLVLAAAILAMATSSRAGDIYWVGDQSACSWPGGTMNKGSWFDGLTWLNFVPPAAGDTAWLQTSFDPQNNDTVPHYIHFGNFRKCPNAPCNPGLVPGGNASISTLRVGNGDWTFDFHSGHTGGACAPPAPLSGSLTTSNDAEVGYAGTNGSLTVRFGAFSVSGALVVGAHGGSGALLVKDGATVYSTAMVAGFGTPPSYGTVNVSGAGATLFVAGPEDQALGLGAGTQGVLMVTDGANAALLGGNFIVGRAGSGTVTVTNGGNVAISPGVLVIGSESPTAAGHVTVDGVGSVLSSSAGIYVGGDYGGNGTLQVLHGGYVGSQWATVGFGRTNSGSVRLDGPGSLWEVANDIGIGIYGAGYATIQDAATLTCSTGAIGTAAGGIGEVTVTGAGSVWTILSSLIIGQAGQGTLVVRAGGRVVAGSINVGPHGTIRGNGVVHSRIFGRGRIQPGQSPGTLTIEGDLIVPAADQSNPAGVLDLQIGGPTPGLDSDKLVVTGNASIHGVLNLQLINGYMPGPGQMLEVIAAAGGNINFETVTGQGVGNGQALALLPANGHLSLMAADVLGVTVAPDSVSIPRGFAARITATANLDGVPPEDVSGSVLWSSDDPSVATVDATGTVTGVAGGTTTVRAAFEGFEADVSVVVIGLPAAGPQTGLDVTYYDFWQPDFASLMPYLTETVPSINFCCGGQFMGSGLDANVGAVLTGHVVAPMGGAYSFYTESDNGSRLFVDGVLVVANGGLHGMTERSGFVVLSAGLHDVRAEFYDYGGGNGLIVRWDGPGISKQPIPPGSWSSPGVNVDYYALTLPSLPVMLPNFDALPEYRRAVAALVNYPLTGDVFAGSGLRDDVGAVYTGYTSIATDGDYTLYLESDDGSKLWIDNQLVVNNDGLHGMFELSGARHLTVGPHAVRIEYFERANEAGLIARIEGPGISKQVIPAAAFSRGVVRGDMNADGVVNSADVPLLVQALLDPAAAGPSALFRADVNANGNADADDIAPFIRCVLAGCP